MAEAEEKEKEKEKQQPVQDRIERALFSRLEYFKENENSVTMASVRRLLEEDLGFEKYALDEHKKFIKQLIEQHLYCDGGGSKNSEENVCKNSDSTAKEMTESPKKHEKDEDLRGPTSKNEENMEEDSPIMGLLTSKVETDGPQGIDINESTIKKAIWERADHIRANSKALSMAGARRLLEEDLGLHKNALEPFKKFINKEIEVVLGPTVSKSDVGYKKESRPSSEGRSHLKHRENSEAEDTAKRRGKTSQIGKDEKSNKLKRYITENEPNNSSKKRKTVKKKAEENSEDENTVGVSEDDGSQSSAEKPLKKKPLPTPVYGKHVEHLKSIIKACGMSVPPSVYKKAKQVPDNKRESFLTKLLEDILSKEGLSSNPSEKEIKEVKKKKERAKELEGIDISNIVTSSRRRSTSNFMVPPIHKRQDGGGDNAKGAKKDNNVRKKDGEKDGKDGSEEKEKEKEEEEEKEGEEEEEEGDDDDDDEEDDDDSENEEVNEDDNDSD